MTRQLVKSIWGMAVGLFLCFGFSVPAVAAAESVRILWDSVPDAAMYEVEIRDEASALATVTTSVPGKEIDLTAFPKTQKLYWCVRPLNGAKQPLGEYSEIKPLATGEKNPAGPLPLTDFSDPQSTLLYPAYYWVPFLGADSYRVSVYAGQPDSGNNSLVVSYQIDGVNSFDCYDWHSYNRAGTYYWQVQALDKAGRPVSDWSKPSVFTVRQRGYTVAALGDSITHGGGALSSPPGVAIYDWTQSISFPIKNLGKSGDTTAALLERFDQDVLPFSPRVLVIFAGINDIRDGVSAVDIIANLKQLKKKALDNQMRPIFVTICPVNPAKVAVQIGRPLPPEWQAVRRTVNRWILSQSDAVDAAALLRDRNDLLPDRLSSDGLHPDSEGKRLIAQAISGKLYEILSQK